MSQNKHLIPNIPNRFFKTVCLILTIVMLQACAASKAKKCGCPTFGDNHKHAYKATSKTDGLSVVATNVNSYQNNK